MNGDGSVIIEVELNTAKARKSYQEFGAEAAAELDKSIGKSKAFSNLSQESVDFARNAVLGISGVATAFAGFSIKAAGDMAALEAQFDQVFDGVGDQATEMLNGIAKDTSMLPNRLKGSFTQMAAFAKTTGMDTADALKLTERATRAAADSAAFYDRSIEDTTESLQSFLKGNFENDAQLGISATETTRNAAANKLYGKSFKDLDEAQKQLTLLQMVEDGNQLSGALGQAAREGNGLENVFGNMKQAITDFAAAFGAPLLDPFLAIVNKLSTGLAKLTEKLKENPALVYAIVGAVGTLAAAFGAVWLAGGGFESALKLVKAGLGAVANPVFLVVAAIGALVTAFIYFYNTSDTFRAKVDGIIKTIKSFAAPLGDVVKGIKLMATAFKAIVTNDFSAPIKDLKEQFTQLFPESVWNNMLSFSQSVKGVVQGLRTLAAAFKAIALDDWSVDVGALKADFLEVFPESLWNGMTKLAQTVKVMIFSFKEGGKSVDFIGIALKVLKAIVLGMLGPFGLFIKAFELIAKVLGGGDVSRGIDMILDGFGSLASGIQKNGPKIGSSAGKAIEGILSAIAGALPGIITGGLKIVAALVDGIAGGIPSLTKAAAKLILVLTGAFLVLAPQMALSATAIIVAFLGALTAGAPQIIAAGAMFIASLLIGLTEQIPMLVEAAASLILTWLTALTEQAPQLIAAGMSFIVSILDGITQKLPDLIGSVALLVTTFLTELAAHAPEMIVAGADLIINVLNGLASKMPDIVAAALNLVVSFLSGIASKLGDVISAAVDIIVAILRGIANNIGRIVDAGMDVVDAIVDGILRAQDRLFRAGITLINGLATNIRKNRGEIAAAGQNLLSALVESLPGGALIQNGIALVSGLLSGLTSGFEKVKSTVSGWAKTIADLKGPISYDKTVLVDNGLALTFGLNRGLSKGFDDVLDNVSGWAGDIQDAVKAAANNKLFNQIMDQVPHIEGLLNGQYRPELAFDTARAAAVKSASTLEKVRRPADEDDDPKYIIVENTIELDGKEVGKATATYVKEENDKRSYILKKVRGED